MKNAFSGMDLGSIFRTQKAEKPVVLAVACMKGDHLESLTAQLKESGFDVSNMAEHEDGSVVFKQGDAEFVAGEKTTVIRLNDEVALVTKGFSPYNLEYADSDTNASFADTCAAQGFYPGVESVMRTMGDMFRTTVSKATDPAEAATSVSKMFDDAKAYALSMVGGLPVAAFKMEGFSVEKHGKFPPKAKEQEMTPEEQAAWDAEQTKIKAKKAEDDASAEAAFKDELTTDAEVGGTAPVTKGEEVDVAALVTAEVTKATASLSDGMKSMLEGITSTITKSMGEMAGQLTDLQSQVVKAEAAAAQATAAVNGTVVSGSALADHVSKRESAPAYQGREVDTAYQTGIRKKAGK